MRRFKRILIKLLALSLIAMLLAGTLAACDSDRVDRYEYERLLDENRLLRSQLNDAQGSGANSGSSIVSEVISRDEFERILNEQQNQLNELQHPEGGRRLPMVCSHMQVGDAVQFGGLDWLVLSIDGDKALLLSEKVLQASPIDSRLNNWENSDIRAFLNGPFIDDTFTEQEKSRIAETWIITGNFFHTEDRVFLLGDDEVNEYMGDTAPESLRDARVAEDLTTGEILWWWLRSPGYGTNLAIFVYIDGSIYTYGSNVTNTHGVRPALWLNI